MTDNQSPKQNAAQRPAAAPLTPEANQCNCASLEADHAALPCDSRISLQVTAAASSVKIDIRALLSKEAHVDVGIILGASAVAKALPLGSESRVGNEEATTPLLPARRLSAPWGAVVHHLLTGGALITLSWLCLILKLPAEIEMALRMVWLMEQLLFHLK